MVKNKGRHKQRGGGYLAGLGNGQALHKLNTWLSRITNQLLLKKYRPGATRYPATVTALHAITRTIQRLVASTLAKKIRKN